MSSSVRVFTVVLVSLFVLLVGCEASSGTLDDSSTVNNSSTDDENNGSVDTNECGGTQTLDATPGDSCGVCGTWTCDGSEALRCEDPGLNACGGCVTLDGTPGSPCTGVQGASACAVWQCQGTDAVQCVDSGTNVCGGCGTLANNPGAPCGTCGTYECATDGSLVCNDPGTNGCGGCAQLPANPGDGCGICGDLTYVCNGTDALNCVDPDGDISTANYLGAFTDANSPAGSLQGSINSTDDPVDWYKIDVTITGAGLNPYFDISPDFAGYTVCAYTDIGPVPSCASGVTSSYNGMQGCCCVSNAILNVQPTKNSGTFYFVVKLNGIAGTCNPGYSITFGL